jgi:hypothetical protein
MLNLKFKSWTTMNLFKLFLMLTLPPVRLNLTGH